MNQTYDDIRIFLATFDTSTEAEEFMAKFINKYGKLDGHDYLCCRFGKSNNGKRWTATLELIPVSLGPFGHATDFGSSLANTDAREISR